jgi:hypothetical protein
MRCPVEIYTPSARPYRGLAELASPFHDKTIHATCCGRICLQRTKMVSFMDYDLGCVDLEDRTLQPLDNLLAQKCNLCVGHALSPMWPDPREMAEEEGL